MRISTEIPLANASQRLLSSLQYRSRRRGYVRPKLHFSIPHFDADSERLFWQERQTETLTALKSALLLGTACILAFIVWDALNGGLSKNEITGCLLMALTFSILCVSLHRHPQVESQINSVAKLSAMLSVADLAGILLVEGNPAFYNQIWIGLLPVYFFVYGQMFMTIAETLKFGLLAMIALPFCGYLTGVEPGALMPSMLILLLVNVFGFCTRCQLEARSRNLFRQRRKAECLSEDKTRFLLQLSHNLCQPLQALNCYSSVLDAAYVDQPNDPLQQVVARLSLAIDEFNVTFSRILDIANLETGRQIPKLAAVDINALLAKLENQFAPLAVQRGLKLNVSLRHRPPYTVYSDASILGQIVGNLIDNAIKYTTSGWVVIKVVKVSDDRLKLHVCDSGIGIADEVHGEIFKEFFRCDRGQTDTQAHGLGIGLSYALKATERLPNHSLQVYSRLHYGSDFQLCLPVHCNELKNFR